MQFRQDETPNDVKKAETAPPERRLRPLRQLLPYVARYHWQASFAVLALLIAAIATLLVPIAVRRMIDFGFSRQGAGLINSYFAVLIAIAGVLALASAARFYLVTTLGERVVADLRERVFAHLVSLSPAYFDRVQSGALSSRLTADTTQIKAAVGSSVSVGLRNLVLFFGATVMMVVTSARLSAFVLAVIPVIVLPLYGFARAVRRRSRTAQDTLADASAYASEMIGSVRVLQAFTNEALARSRFGAAVEHAFVAARSSIRARALLTALAIFLVFGSVVVVLWIGAQDVLAGRLSPGTLSQFLLYAVLGAAGLGQLSEAWGELSQASGAAERLFEILAVPAGILRPAHPLALPQPSRGEVAFADVRFSYPTRSETAALAGISFRIRRGEKVAVVGPSGAGKSTVFALMLRFYDPLAGTITFDGVPLVALDPAELRGRIALVPQQPAGQRRRIGARGRARARASFHKTAATGLRYSRRRAWGHTLGRRAPAPCDCARDPAQCAASFARRSHLVSGCAKRNAGQDGARSSDEGAHHPRHCSSARDGLVLRPHSGDGSGPHRCRGDP
jgi:ATP-binding cassette subfamily B protein